jgi:hypothetical protein
VCQRSVSVAGELCGPIGIETMPSCPESNWVAAGAFESGKAMPVLRLHGTLQAVIVCHS